MSSEPDYSHLEAQYFTPEYASPLDTLVILDGAPVVGPDRASKLVGAIRKAAQKEGGLVLDDSAFEMPLADDGLKSKGFLFVTLPNEADVATFQRAMHDYPFDKKHTFKVVPFSAVDRYAALPEEYLAPALEPWAPRVRFLSFTHRGSPKKIGTLPRLARRPRRTRPAAALPWRRRCDCLEHQGGRTRVCIREDCPSSLRLLLVLTPNSAGPTRTPNGRRSGLFSPRSTRKECRSGEDLPSDPSTDSLTPRSSSSTSRPLRNTSSRGPPSRSRRVVGHPLRRTTRGMRSRCGRS